MLKLDYGFNHRNPFDADELYGIDIRPHKIKTLKWSI